MKGRDCRAPYCSTEKIEVEKLKFGKKMKPGGRSSSMGTSSVGTSKEIFCKGNADVSRRMFPVWRLSFRRLEFPVRLRSGAEGAPL